MRPGRSAGSRRRPGRLPSHPPAGATPAVVTQRVARPVAQIACRMTGIQRRDPTDVQDRHESSVLPMRPASEGGGMPHSRVISLLDADPDIAAAIPAADQGLAARVLALPRLDLPGGPFTVPDRASWHGPVTAL